MKDLFNIPQGFTEFSDAELAEWISAAASVAAEIGASPEKFVSDDFSQADLVEAMTAGVAALEEAKAELESRGQAAKKPTDDDEGVDDSQQDAAVELESLAALAERAASLAQGDEDDGDEDDAAADADAAGAAGEADAGDADAAGDASGEAAAAEAATTASGERAPSGSRMRLQRPARARRAAPPVQEERAALTAAAEGLGYALGSELPDATAVAEMMIARRRMFGGIPEGTHGDTIPIARAEWGHLYPVERKLTEDGLETNWDRIQSATSEQIIRSQFAKRKSAVESGEFGLTASGGLCAPVTNYYNLQMISVADRPVRAALPSFNADRGGIRNARPAGLPVVTTGVGVKTVAEDAAGGSEATKTCQVVSCPDFTETDIEIVYHCLQFGNVGARTFPERVAQWNSLVLAAHARAAETVLLDAIYANSTHVTATDLGLGASASLLSQAVTAANGLRSRNRMAPDSVLRALFPIWVRDLLVSDVYRSQFQRFDMDAQKFVTILRDNNIEPSFYLDSPTGLGQVFPVQSAGALVAFPSTVEWFLFPEGSHLYLDGGILELGLVRDSVLNRTNDFQIFGESFENAAFVGVESLAIASTVCDSGAVSAPVTVTECGDYGIS